MVGAKDHSADLRASLASATTLRRGDQLTECSMSSCPVHRSLPPTRRSSSDENLVPGQVSNTRLNARLRPPYSSVRVFATSAPVAPTCVPMYAVLDLSSGYVGSCKRTAENTHSPTLGEQRCGESD